MSPLIILALSGVGVLLASFGFAALGELGRRRYEQRRRQIRDASQAELLRWEAAMRAAHDPQEPEGSESPT